MVKMKHLLGSMRLPFLILTPACVFLGFATAVWETGHVNFGFFLLALLGALTAHLSVNIFNEYFDFRSGVDSRTKRTPFSGGSGTLQQYPELANKVLILAIVAALITIGIGVFFWLQRGIGILPVGIIGLLIVLIYSPWLVKNPYLCLVAPGLGFGTMMVLGTHFVLTGFYSPAAVLASLIPFFLVNNLLLLNQFPDVEADESAGRKTLPVVFGRRIGILVYAIFILLIFVTIPAGILFFEFPLETLLGELAIFLAIPAVIIAYRQADNIKKLMPAMGLNVILNIVTPILTAIGFLIGKP